MNPMVIAAAVGLGVYLLTRGAQSGSTVSVPTPLDSPPQDDVGGPTHDSTPVQSENGSGAPYRDDAEGRVVALPWLPGSKTPILTAPPPSGGFRKPFPHGGSNPPRDHRDVRPPSRVPPTGGMGGGKVGGGKVGQIACIRAPCPAVPTSRGADPHQIGLFAAKRLSKEPVAF